jgi:nucleotide-binding universal stress UspA family protein
MGMAADTINATAADVDADVVVMSTHAYTGPLRAVVGSVADAVLRTAGRPVLLVRRPRAVLETPASDREPQKAGA